MKVVRPIPAALPHSMEPIAIFLRRLDGLAEAMPCVIHRADLLRLLALTGLVDTDAFGVIAQGGNDPLTTERTGLLAAIEFARRADRTRSHKAEATRKH